MDANEEYGRRAAPDRPAKNARISRKTTKPWPLNLVYDLFVQIKN